MGKAVAYMLKHWEPLTQFLRVQGAPLDNNLRRVSETMTQTADRLRYMV